MKSATSNAQKQVRLEAVERQTATSLAWSRNVSTSLYTLNRQQTAGHPVTIVVDVPVALPRSSTRPPLSLTAQRTAARLADTLELLEGEVGGDPEWSQRVEAALEELKEGTGRNGRLAGRSASMRSSRLRMSPSNLTGHTVTLSLQQFTAPRLRGSARS